MALGSLVDSVGFDLINSDLGKDVELALKAALADGAVFLAGRDALGIFRQVLASSIRSIESHPKGRLIRDFLIKGPYEDVGDIPKDLATQRLSDQETAAAITFIYSHMVNSFKGAVTELLAAKACLRLLRMLQKDGRLPQNARLYVTDSVGIRSDKGKGLAKGADLHILAEKRIPGKGLAIAVAGVAEVKSYTPPKSYLREQLARHIRRAKQGLQAEGIDYPAEKVIIGLGKDRNVVRIAVVPSEWKLPRSFHFEESQDCRVLCTDPYKLPRTDDEIMRSAIDEWNITLRWSKEAIAEAAYWMTFWYMEKIGEVIYSEGVPKGWEGMTAAHAGRNAAKTMLYYAILRCRSSRDEQRAIALYNTYGYGFALGMNYKNSRGRRVMLWPQDLDELLLVGKTKDGCKLS